MSVSTLSDRFTRREALIALSVCCAVVSLVLALSAFIFARPLEGAQHQVSALQLRVRQVRADSLALREALMSIELIQRLGNQQDLANAAFASLRESVNTDSGPLDMTVVAPAWDAAMSAWQNQLTGARSAVDDANQRAALADQLDEAHAIGLSLARTVFGGTTLGPAQRVAWLQWPLTLAELRVRVAAAGGYLASEMAAPISAAHDDTRALIDSSASDISDRAREGLEVVQALLANAESQFASPSAAPPAVATADSAARELEAALMGAGDALAVALSRWSTAKWVAVIAGVFSMLGFSLAHAMSVSGTSVLNARRSGRQQALLTAARRLVSDSKRDYQFARALNGASAKRHDRLEQLSSDAHALAASASRLSKPRELVLNLGRQHANSQRTLGKQMASTGLALQETKQHAQRWAQRCEASKDLHRSTRELGERAALLQVNARIRMGWSETELSEDFQRLNDSMRRVMTQTESLVRHQGDAAQRTLASLVKSIDLHADSDSTVAHAARQLQAYVNGQSDLSGRYDKLDTELSSYEVKLQELQEQAASDQELEARALKARRATAKFAEQVNRLILFEPADEAKAPPPARSAPQRARATRAVDSAEVEV